MTTFASMAARVLVNTPECPQPSAEIYLRLAAIELCRRGKPWRAVLAAASLTSTNFPYTITPPVGARVVKVLSVAVNGTAPPLEETDIRTAEQTTDDWRTATGTPTHFIETSRGTITIVPLPIEAASFVSTVAYEPTESATDIPDAVYDEYGSAIISGAIYMLAVIPGKPWTSAPLATLHHALFERGIETAEAEFGKHYAMAPLLTSPSPI